MQTDPFTLLGDWVNKSDRGDTGSHSVLEKNIYNSKLFSLSAATRKRKPDNLLCPRINCRTQGF